MKILIIEIDWDSSGERGEVNFLSFSRHDFRFEWKNVPCNFLIEFRPRRLAEVE